MHWTGEGDLPVEDFQVPILAFSLPTFFLGKHFGCPPHSWDHLPPERVFLDYFIMSAFKEIEAEEMEKIKHEQSIGQSQGRPVRTTSDKDFFDRMNARLKDDG
tara:strand:+ start:5813 stop:6121 length:309 start_codon:yes stop_codon:yes gene_type:complete